MLAMSSATACAEEGAPAPSDEPPSPPGALHEHESPERAAPPDEAPPKPEVPPEEDLEALAGRYRDPWFGDVEICPTGDRVRFVAMKSPKLAGELLRVGSRLMVQWEAVDVDTDAWLDFETHAGAIALP